MCITELDELQHSASDDWLWRESFRFDFHDASWIRLGQWAYVDGAAGTVEAIE